MQRTEEPTYPIDTLTREQAEAASQRLRNQETPATPRDTKGSEKDSQLKGMLLGELMDSARERKLEWEEENLGKWG